MRDSQDESDRQEKPERHIDHRDVDYQYQCDGPNHGIAEDVGEWVDAILLQESDLGDDNRPEQHSDLVALHEIRHVFHSLIGKSSKTIDGLSQIVHRLF